MAHSLLKLAPGLCLLFITLAASSSAFEEGSSRQILILASYNPGLPWTDSVGNEIKNQLSIYYPGAEFSFEYMDTKRQEPTEARLNELNNLYKNKYEDRHFDVIICSDDDAFQFLLNNRDELFSSTPVVFCGVDFFEDQMLTAGRNFTGVVEAFDIPGTISLMLKLHPDTKQIVIVDDQAATSKASQEAINQTLSRFSTNVRFTIWNDMTVEELQRNASVLQEGSLILLLDYDNDREGRAVTHEESAWILRSASSVPIYGTRDVYMGFGVLGGAITTGQVQGRLAADLAHRILQGVPADDIPVVKELPSSYIFDMQELRRFNISVQRSASSAPIHGTQDVHMGFDVLGEAITTDQVQGGSAADMEHSILQGVPADDIPVIKELPSSNIFDMLELRRFNVSLLILPSGSKFVNQPLQARVDLNNRNLSGLDLSGTDLSYSDLLGSDLSGTNLSRSFLVQAVISNSTLNRANLSGALMPLADLHGSNLSGADLRGATLLGNYMMGSNLTDADLSGSLMDQAMMDNSTLVDARLDGASLWAAKVSDANLSGASFINAFMERSTFKNSQLKGVNLTGASLVGANLINATITDADLSGADISEARCAGADFSSSRLVGSTLGFTNLTGANLSMANLSGSYLVASNLDDSDLEKANLENADLTRALLSGCNLTGANLNGARLQGTDLSLAVMNDVYLNGANLLGAKLNWANLGGSVLKNSQFARAELFGANLSNCDLTNSDFTRSYLLRANLFRSNLENAKFNSADLAGANLSKTSFAGSSLNGANLNDVVLSGADLSGATLDSMIVKRVNMHRTVLRSAVLNMISLEDADLSEADLRNARFNAVILTNVNLAGADLRGADFNTTGLIGVDLGRANLLGIKYDKLALQFIAACNLEGAKMSADLQKDLEDLRSGQRS
jgi:uncharacterized protein YjbI with pentapeptide repeats